MFRRVDLVQLRAFISFGGQSNPFKNPSSLEKADAITKRVLKNLAEGKITYDQASENLNEALYIYEEIHTITGMRLGARLISQLLN